MKRAMSAWELKRLMTGAPPMAAYYLALATVHDERALRKLRSTRSQSEKD